jgi:hypothetical protein
MPNQLISIRLSKNTLAALKIMAEEVHRDRNGFIRDLIETAKENWMAKRHPRRPDPEMAELATAPVVVKPHPPAIEVVEVAPITPAEHAAVSAPASPVQPHLSVKRGSPAAPAAPAEFAAPNAQPGQPVFTLDDLVPKPEE